VAAEKLNGLRLQPGETFSFNKRVGERTADAGFMESTILFQGVEQKGIGGGVCSVSTGLYQAVMQADLKVLERHPHSRPRSYAGLGRDAAVNWPDLDLRFENDKDREVQLVTRVTRTGLWVELTSESELPQSTTSLWKPGAPTPFSTHEIVSKYVKKPKLVRKGDFGAPGVTIWVAWTEEGDAGAKPGKARRVRSNYKPVHEVYVVPPKGDE
jgi:vancomycin resistance protein YoaR